MRFIGVLCICLLATGIVAEEPGNPSQTDPLNPADSNGPNATPSTQDPSAKQPGAQTSIPTTPAGFQNYRTDREKRNESFRALYSQEADRRFRFILELISEGRTESARSRLQEFLVLYPNHSMADRARRELANLERADGEYGPALYHYEQSAVLERPGSGEARALLETARIQIREGDFDRARAVLQSIQKRFSGTREAQEAALLEKSYRFIERPSQTSERDKNSPSEVSDSENPADSTSETNRPLFPVAEKPTSNTSEPTQDHSGIDTADGKPSTGQTALDRMGEGVEKPEKDRSMPPMEPLDGDIKKSP